MISEEIQSGGASGEKLDNNFIVVRLWFKDEAGMKKTTTRTYGTAYRSLLAMCRSNRFSIFRVKIIEDMCSRQKKEGPPKQVLVVVSLIEKDFQRIIKHAPNFHKKIKRYINGSVLVG